MKLAAVREQLATEIAAVTDADVAVAEYPPDQTAVPAAFVMWGTPWLTLRNKCKWDANIDVLLVAARFDPSGAFATIEDLAEAVLPLITEGGAWRFSFLESPAPMDIGGVTYLAARLTVATTIDN